MEVPNFILASAFTLLQYIMFVSHMDTYESNINYDTKLHFKNYIFSILNQRETHIYSLRIDFVNVPQMNPVLYAKRSVQE